MPNYCDNILSIEATPDVLDQLRRFVASEENEFDFEKIIPMPGNLFMGNIGTEEKERYGGRNWYDWRSRCWGTKWNSVDAQCSKLDTCLNYYFLTAWEPSEPVIVELAKLFPDAKIQYSFYEAGMCFCGKREYENGKIVYSMDGDYNQDYYDLSDEKDLKRFNQYEKGTFCDVKNYSNNDSGATYEISYRDTNEERTIFIEGFCIDARAVKSDFCWDS